MGEGDNWGSLPWPPSVRGPPKDLANLIHHSHRSLASLPGSFHCIVEPASLLCVYAANANLIYCTPYMTSAQSARAPYVILF